ncbi:MAG: penicillin-binding protein 2 [Myxococcales bacterium]|nr:MAG: penicillin-binding protein 2 [Myxococcales bacterium]
MLEKDYRKVRVRLVVVAACLFVAFGLLFARAWVAQIVEGDTHWAAARRQTLGSVVIQPRRGAIYDRMKRVLGTNEQAPSLTAQPRLMSDGERETAVKLLRQLFGPASKHAERLKEDKYFVWVERWLSPEEVERFNALYNALPEAERPTHLALMDEDKRYYPDGSLAANVLGFADIDLDGKMGVEKAFNAELAGSTLVVEGFRDASGQRVSLESLDLSLNHPTGNAVMLTIDRTVQYVAERVLAETMAQHKAHEGVVVVMDPTTGEILALAQQPTFDPNDLNGAKMERVHNFAIEHAYEPGSTMKPFLIGSAIDLALYVPEDRIDCGLGEFAIGPNTIHDTKRYGWLTISEVLIKSSNICTAKIGMEMGAQRVYEQLKKFGFGEKTGIALPAETRGLINPWADWYPIDLATISFGQGLNVPPLQMAAAMGAIANGGVLMQPQIVKRILTPEGEVKQEFKPVEVRRVISSQTAARLRDILVEAVSDHGTGRRAYVSGCPVAGKTGTAEKLAKNHRTGTRDYWTSSFLGFLPADAPKLVILVLIDEPSNAAYYGGEVAAPAFAAIAREVAPMLGLCVRRSELAEAP